MTNILKTIVHTFIPATLALAASACAVDNGVQLDAHELGAQTPGNKKEIKIQAQKGSVAIPVLANAEWQAEFVDNYSYDWAVIKNKTNTNDTDLVIDYKANDYFPRMAKIRVFSATRSDTVLLKQTGAINPLLELPSQSITVSEQGGEYYARLNTNLDMKDIKVEVMYPDQQGVKWIDNYSYANGHLVFDGQPNTTEQVRNARFIMRYVNGWEEVISQTLYQTQANKNGEFGTLVTFPQLRLNTGVITQDYLIEGYVVSNKESRNAGEQSQNTETQYGSDDQTLKTTYLESTDGQYGFRLVCKTPEDNIFKQYDKVLIMLKGASLNADPYTGIRSFNISGITSAMVLHSESAVGQIPVKRKSMSQLTDDDIYTYVTLTDCEIPVRKGSLTPVNEGYTPLSNAFRIAKYPLLIRDIAGSSMHLMTNIYCPYRRDGSVLPYGSGELKGVIVHERFTRFAYSKSNMPNDEMNGYIGRYQLRHQNKSDIYDGMKSRFEDGFSEMAFEVSYARITNNKAECTLNNRSGYVTVTSIAPGASLWGSADWSDLGPCGPGYMVYEKTGDPCGIIMATADCPSGTYTAYFDKNDGKGNSGKVSGNGGATKYSTTMATGYTWNYDDPTDGPNGSADGFLICFSTKGIQTNLLSMQLAVYTAQNAPRWWKVEWSTGGTKQSQWNYIDSYTTAMAPNWGGARFWDLAGPKNIDIKLPLEMLDRENVYLRLVPEENATSSYELYYNPDRKIENASCYLFYAGIRYNKK